MEEDILVKKKKKNRFGNYNKYIILMFTLGLLLVLVGFSYAFFVYNKTGLYTHTITGGKMSIIYNETAGNNITLSNSYPLTDKEALTDALEFEFTITGYNESEKNIYYAIEMDYGSDIDGFNRFKDTDLKFSLLENDSEVLKNKVFNNLDNQDIYYGNIGMGTSKDSPVTNNYEVKIWINDYVIISDTISDDLSTWSDFEWDFLEDYNKKVYNAMINSDSPNLSDFGMSIYTTSEFQRMYANFKVNVTADLTYDEVGFVTYDANGGSFTPKKTSLTTNKVTLEKPVMENKGFLGWSSTPNGEVEYYSGDPYNGEYDVLYAIYSDTRNVMVEYWPEAIVETMHEMMENNVTVNVEFINETQEEIARRALESGVYMDLTKDNQGMVILWVEFVSDTEYIFYIGSEGTTYLSSGAYLFSYSSAKYIYLTNVDTSMVKDMSHMFGGGINNQIDLEGPVYLEEIDISHFNTNNVKDMSFMFFNASSLKEINVSNFNTSNVENMAFMFCSFGFSKLNVKELDVSNFDTSKVTNMSYMFSGCCGLTELDVSNFDTSQVTDMSYMFGFAVDDYADHFYFPGIENVEVLDVSNWDTSKVENMCSMFAACKSLLALDISKWNTVNVTDMSYMFEGCNKITTLDISNFETSNVKNMMYMFSGCASLKKLDVSKFKTSNVENMMNMFIGCSNLVSLDLSNFNTSNVTNMAYMFSGCSDIKNFSLESWNVANVTDMQYMFNYCSGLTTLNLQYFYTSSLKSIYSIFAGCSNLTSVDLSNFDTSNATDMRDVFKDCSSLTTIDLSSFTINNADISYMFYNCSSLITLDLSNFETDEVTSCDRMFYNCSNLVTLDISNFNLENIKIVREIFKGCNKLTTIYCNYDWNNGYLDNQDMFIDCVSLVGAIPFDSTKVDITMANPTTGYFTRKNA